MKNNSVQSFIVLSLALYTVFLLMPEFSFAGTGGEELQGIYDKTVAVAQGNGGKLIAVLSFIGALIAAARGSLAAFVPAIGVSAIAGVGPTMVTSGISALI